MGGSIAPLGWDSARRAQLMRPATTIAIVILLVFILAAGLVVTIQLMRG